MFLLIRICAKPSSTTLIYTLHSTMFLLIQSADSSSKVPGTTFTFHDVSINTKIADSGLTTGNPLHSTMFLLILWDCRVRLGIWYFTFHDVSINTIAVITIDETPTLFTFHDVSINTKQDSCQCRCDDTLHSTMFLLIPWRIYTSRRDDCFTFHDVSINTKEVE